MNNGHINQSGVIVQKDTLIYPKDINKVRQFYEEKGDGIKKKARKDFENDN